MSQELICSESGIQPAIPGHIASLSKTPVASKRVVLTPRTASHPPHIHFIPSEPPTAQHFSHHPKHPGQLFLFNSFYIPASLPSEHTNMGSAPLPSPYPLPLQLPGHLQLQQIQTVNSRTKKGQAVTVSYS